MATKLFTIREAAGQCGISHQSMRKRVDRGTARSLKKDGGRLIPHDELERVEVWPGSKERRLSTSLKLRHLRSKLDHAPAELATVRPQLDAAHDSRERSEAAMHQRRAEAPAARAVIERLTAGGLVSGIRALRVLQRRAQTADDNQPVTV